jgi:pimeloyl-ACP methyl ester carboxylesterase
VHVIGHSMGGGTALELAVNHPDRLLAVVPISASVRPEGMHPDLADPSTYATSTRMPTEQDFADMAAAYARVAPHPERFGDLPARSMTSEKGWDVHRLGPPAPHLRAHRRTAHHRRPGKDQRRGASALRMTARAPGVTTTRRTHPTTTPDK